MRILCTNRVTINVENFYVKSLENSGIVNKMHRQFLYN